MLWGNPAVKTLDGYDWENIRFPVEKGAIRRIEPKFVCQPLVTKEQTQVYEINALAERLFDGSLEKLRKVVEEMVG